MASRHSHAENLPQCSLVADNPLVYMRKITRHRSDHTHMFSICCKLDWYFSNVKRRYLSGVLDIVSFMFGEDQQFSLPSRELNLVFVTVCKRKVEKTL